MPERGVGTAALLLAAASLATPVAQAREPLPDPLRLAIERVIDRPQFKAAFWGVEVRSLRSGRVLYARNAGKNLKPASTFKLLTTAAVLDALAPDERLRTTVESAGRVDAAGRLIGDVFHYVRGDTSLSGRFVDGR